MVIRCTVRGCNEGLARAGEALRCTRGHSFDRAREGYWNLLQPQDRRSARPGDTAAALEARRRWLARGFADGLLAAAGRLIDALSLPSGATVLDLGCGEGTLMRRLLGARPVSIIGVDLSAVGCGMAARLMPEATILVANVDRSIPVLDRTVDLVVSFFGRRPLPEVARVLRPGGAFLTVQPGSEDFAELRAAVLGAGRRVRRPDPLPGEASHWQERHLHDAEALRDALDMSYRGGRASRLDRLARLGSLEVTLAADLVVWRNVQGEAGPCESGRERSS